MKNSTCSPVFAFIAKGCAFTADLFITNSLAITSYISIFATYNQVCSCHYTQHHPLTLKVLKSFQEEKKCFSVYDTICSVYIYTLYIYCLARKKKSCSGVYLSLRSILKTYQLSNDNISLLILKQLITQVCL